MSQHHDHTPAPPSDVPEAASRGPTLARKLLLHILPVVVLSVFVVGLMSYSVARSQISRYIHNEVDMLAEQVTASAHEFLMQRERDADHLAETPLLNEYHQAVSFGPSFAPEASMAQEELESYFGRFAGRNHVYATVAHFDADANLVAGTSQAGKLEPGTPKDQVLPGPLPDMAYHKQYRSPVLTTSDGHNRLLIARSIRDPQGQFWGALVLVCDLSVLEEVLRRTQVGANGRSYLVNTVGDVVVGGPARTSADLQRHMPLTGSPWTVVIEAQAEEFLGPLNRLRNLTIAFSLASAMLVSMMLIAGIRSAVRPLAEVTEGTRRLAQGELDHRLPVPRIRDLKPLALAFNDMAGKLKERDEQVQARLRELSALRLMENTSTQQMSQESLLRTCLRAVAYGQGFDRVGLYWIDADSGAIIGRYLHNNVPGRLAEPEFQRRRVPLDGDDVLNRVIRAREPLLVKDPHSEVGVDGGFVRNARTLEFVMAPLCGKDNVFGVIVADNYASGNELTEQHRDGLGLFASAAGLALENAMLIERITESETRHRSVLDNSPIAILGVSRDHRVRTWNRGAENIFGYTPEQILGEPLDTVIAPSAHDQLDTLIQELMRHGTVHGFSLKGRARDGRELDLSLFCGGEDKEHFLANDEWTVVINDVTESRKLHDQLIKSEKLSAVGQLIAGVAHEINNPLQAVVGYTELLTERDGQALHREELQHILDNATRCRKIVDNLLLFVRHGDVEQKTVCVQDAIEGALNLFRHRAKRVPEITLSTHGPDEPMHVTGNFQQIEQVLINLLSNAYDALEGWSGEQAVHIHVIAVNEGGEPRVRVEVRDTGPGVPMEVKEQLFEPLFTTKPEGRGTGLGLPLCRQLIEDHHGTLDVVNDDKGGARFYFELPRVAAPTPRTDVAPPSNAAVEPQRVLLLEDESAIRALLHDMLGAEGHDVRVSENVAQARELAQNESFTLVVTDIHLPDGTGLDFFEAWGRHSTRPRPRFLFLTGDIVTREMEQMCQANGARVLQKPVDLREFRATLRALVEQPTAMASA